MPDRHKFARPRDILRKGLPLDACVVLLWRFGWGHSWTASLLCGGILFALTGAVALYSWWWHRNPERVAGGAAKMDAHEGAAAERLAAQAAAADAANRSSGRQPGSRY